MCTDRWMLDLGGGTPNYAKARTNFQCPGNGPQYEGTVPHIKRSFLAGAEAFVHPWIDS